MWGQLNNLTKNVQGAVGNFVAPEYEEEGEYPHHHEGEPRQTPTGNGGARGAAPPSAAPSSADLEAEVASLQKAKADDEDMIGQLQNQLKESYDMCRDLQGKLTAAEKKFADTAKPESEVVEDLRKQLETAQAENASIIKQTEEYGRQVTESHNATVAHFTNLQEQRDEEFTTKINELETIIATLEQKAEHQQQNTNSSEELEQLAATNRLLQEEIRDHQDVVKEIAAERDSFKSLSEELSVKADRTDAADERCEQLKVELSSAFEQVMQLQQDVEKAKAAQQSQQPTGPSANELQQEKLLKDTTAELQVLQGTVHTLKQELDAAKTAQTAAEKRVNELEQDPFGTAQPEPQQTGPSANEVELEKQLEESTTKLNAMQSNMTLLQQELDAAKTAQTAAEKRVNELEQDPFGAAPQQDGGAADLDNVFSNGPAVAGIPEEEHEVVKNRLTEAEMLVQQLQHDQAAQLAAVTSQHGDAVAQLKVELQEQQQLAEKNMAERDQLQLQLEEEQNVRETDRRMVEKAAEERGAAQAAAQLAQVTEQAEQMRSQLSTTQQSATEASSQVQALRAQEEALRAEIDALKQQSGGLDGRARQLVEAKHEVASLTAALEEAKAASEKLKADSEELYEQIRKVTAERDEAAAAAAEASSNTAVPSVVVDDQELASLKNENSSLMLKIEGAAEAVVKSNATVAEQETLIQELRSKMGAQEHQLMAVQSELDFAKESSADKAGAAEDQLAQLGSELEQTKKQLAAAEETVQIKTAEANAALASSGESAAAVAKELSSAKELASHQTAIAEEANKRVAELESEVETLTSRYKEACDSANQWVEAANGQVQAREAAEKQLQDTRAELENATTAVKEAETRIADLETAHKTLQDKATNAEDAKVQELETTVAQLKEEKAELVKVHQQQLADASETLENVKKDTMAEATEKAKRDSEDRIKSLEEELASAIRGRELDKSTLAHGQTNVAALTAQRDELQKECTRFRDLTSEVHRVAVETLLRANVKLPVGATFSDSVTSLVAEYSDASTKLAESVKVQQQWTDTYNQARKINEETNGQLQGAWKQVSELREEMALKELNVAKLTKQLNAESVRSNEVQVALTKAQQQLEVLKEQAAGEQERAKTNSSNASVYEERILVLNGELDALKMTLHDREAEVTTSQKAVANLQNVLEEFQTQKTKDIEERTMYLNHEVESLKAQVVAMNAQRNEKRDEIEAKDAAHRKEVASKNVAISALQSKLSELRRVLEETVVKLNDEQMIDKRVVSQLLINHIHSVVEERGDDQDIVRVMSGLLSWGDEEMERAGLIPGPLAPVPVARKGAAATIIGGVGGVVGSFWGAAQSVGAHAVGRPANAGKAGSPNKAQPSSIAAAWVDFLIKEGEKASQEAAQAIDEAGGDANVAAEAPPAAAPQTPPHAP